MDNLKLFDAEYRFMCVLWEHEPVNSTELVRLCNDHFEWKKSTTYSMIKRLGERGILKNENAVVTALVRKEDVQKYESEVLMEKAFDNSLPVFLTAFLRGKKLSRSEAEKLKKMIEEATK
ncbi:MAG: BlaI/MecI/CopY family transcriptional regulator [Pseudomonadota bacterium]